MWLELWDDCGPMGDQVKYREAIQTIFFDGLEPGEVEFTDKDGNKRTIRKPGAAPDLSAPIPSHALKALEDMKAQIAAAHPTSE